MQKFRSSSVGPAWIVAVAITIFAGAARAAVVQTAEPFIGVTHVRLIERRDDLQADLVLPRELVVDVLLIDPEAPGIDFTLQPGNGPKPGEVTRVRTRAFIDEIGAQIGVNVGFYDTRATYTDQPPEYYTDLMHTAVAEGVGYSANAGPDAPIFNLSEDNRPMMLHAREADTYETREGVALFNATGGNQALVRDGKNVTPDDRYTRALHPHTALGMTRDGKVLILTVDGRQDTYSKGMRTDEIADLLIQHFDVTDAINLDGGGSTNLVMDDTNDAIVNSRIVNSPSDHATPHEPGEERLIANSLAVFARFNPDYQPLPPAPRPEQVPPLPVIESDYAIDDFEQDLGHFKSAVDASGSSRGIAHTSTSRRVKNAFAGRHAMRLDIVSQPTKEPGQAMMLRLLSGDAQPARNLLDDRALAAVGRLQLSVRLDDGAPPLFVAVMCDDGSLQHTQLERSVTRQIPGDGQWHQVDWELNDAESWRNFYGGNGQIDGPNVFIDSLYFSTVDPDGDRGEGGLWEGSVWLDEFRYLPPAAAEPR